MRLIFAFVAALLTGSLAIPVGKEEHQEDVVKRCLVEVLSKALSKQDAQLDQECKNIIQAGINRPPPDKKSAEGIVTQEEVLDGHAQEPADVKDIEALLKSVEANREHSEGERSQETWSLDDKTGGGEREKRSSWRPGRFHQKKSKRGEEEDYERSQEHWGDMEKRLMGDIEDDEADEESEEREKRNWRPGRYHQRKHKRDEGEEEEPEEERSQESWDVDKRDEEEDEEREKRIWKPTHRYHHKKTLHRRSNEPSGHEGYEDRSQESWDLDKRNWKPGRFHQRRHKRNEELSEEPRENPDEERSQEYWDFDTGMEKRSWRPGRYYQRKHKRDEELSEDPDEEHSQEYWDFDTGMEKRSWRPGRYYQRKHKRDEELSEDPDEERSQEYWDFDTGREKKNWRPGRFHQRRQKRDEDLLEETKEDPEEERSQEYWDFDTGVDKRNWRPGRHYQRKHKRDEELSQEAREEPKGERSQEDWGLDKRHGKEEEKQIWKPTHRYHYKRKLHKTGGSSEEQGEERGDSGEYAEEAKDRDEALRYLAEKRNPWIYRGFYHPAWYKRDSDEPAETPNKMDELAKLLSYKINHLTNHSAQEETLRQRALTPQEEKKLENLAAMDTELQKIAAKLHDRTA